MNVLEGKLTGAEDIKIAVINNSSEAQYTEVYINGNCVYKLDMEPGEMRWVDDVE